VSSSIFQGTFIGKTTAFEAAESQEIMRLEAMDCVMQYGDIMGARFKV
jgi:hypothetical protein